MKHYAIIVAGGSGNRMQTETPKQFLLLCGIPVLMHTIKTFAQSSFYPEIIVVIHPDYHQLWQNLCQEFNFHVPHQIVAGGKERFHSVKNALDLINGDGVVAVHDAVRCLTSTKLIDDCYSHALEFGNAIAAVKSTDSIRQLVGTSTKMVNRDDFYLVQTPQTFKIDLLKDAYNQDFSSDFTDDASVIEQQGHAIRIVEGEKSNIKITYPIDLEFAELTLQKKAL
ncbi:2-C-methyl-D-erythritol 4-phosphate cytidylyltransferase [Pedobacter sp. AW1-32]|uniref:2-C-methyl-D-erythritol 4-phosphate cytidylyltransferase n=1 Tax=Pedobacter sp. AW1-32 TaxID=3383026 RepID=UPI003FF019E5